MWIKIPWYVSNTVTAGLPKRSQRLFFASEQTWTPQIPLAESKFLFRTIMFNGSSLFQGVFVVLFFEVFNYIGGALIYIRSQYAERVKLLSSSWVDANRDRDKNKQKETLVTSRPRAFGWLFGCLPFLLGSMATLVFLGLFINHCKDPYMNQSGFHSSFLSCQGVECCSDFEFGSGFWDECHFFWKGG